ncbi:hypothetical protein [Pseudomonas fluorescens]|uniref:hypothetical protein n=1 Tax=Pseudomonas fluorescens TaxID=294 RepID=UPI00259BB46D|nr:hypothetical protein [Pseudomonas fluorescens]WJK11775.1 hypothetical protein QR290_10645 [Pseudomonas fluorescens]
MNEQHHSQDTDQPIQTDEQTPQNDATNSDNLKRQKRSVMGEGSAKKKKGSGGMDSLGGGRIV